MLLWHQRCDLRALVQEAKPKSAGEGSSLPWLQEGLEQIESFIADDARVAITYICVHVLYSRCIMGGVVVERIRFTARI